jgi:hypothetical protein
MAATHVAAIFFWQKRFPLQTPAPSFLIPALQYKNSLKNLANLEQICMKST